MGNIWAVSQTLLFCDLDLQFQDHWWPLKGQIFLAIFSHFGPVLIYRKLDHPMAGTYNTYICPLQACRNLTLKLFIEGHPLTAKVPDRGHFWPLWRYFHLLLTILHGWKLLNMALEVEYMMEYQYPGLLGTEDCWLQRKCADSTIMDRKKAVVSYKPTTVEM